MEWDVCGIAPRWSSPGRRHRSAGRRLWHVATAVHYRNSDRVRVLPSGKSKTSDDRRIGTIAAYNMVSRFVVATGLDLE
jgi:hypothetical protein